ncbi:MAG: cation:proton antiporter [Flavobacteriaceae bacterium]
MGTLDTLFVLPLLIIFSYLFDAFARKTKFPSVILLMGTGIALRALTQSFGYTQFSFLDNLIPVLGTIGLILIVLEGALELDLKLNKLKVILKGFLAALVLLVANVIILRWGFEVFLAYDPQQALIYAIPLSIISSAVAIPSAANLIDTEKEFVVYESTFSDILGIMLFYYAIGQVEKQESLLGWEPLGKLSLQIVGIIVGSVAISFALLWLIKQIEHQVKFFLILALLILVYALGKYFHLPALVTIFIFGLFLSNSQQLLPSFLKSQLSEEETAEELHEFHLLTAESTFIVRTFFFLFFGFSIPLSNFTAPMPYLIGLLILGAMFGLRYLYFMLTQLKIRPGALAYMAPRGLISILLFLQIKDLDFLKAFKTGLNEQELLVVILFSMVLMTLGTVGKSSATDPAEENLELPTEPLEELTDDDAPELLIEPPHQEENSSDEIS